ncbi:DUF6794 domain-containing protein [Hymenobacter sp. 5516J-16]|uniref:DUF6794 domain-containing protein n=1 Tax=Hymenobacter sp. 5516J-16 TaxID=2932253 RepID=UPI00397DA047
MISHDIQPTKAVRSIIMVWLLLSTLWCSGQSISINEHGFYIPRNLTEANEQLDKVLTDKAKAKFKRLTPSDFENISGLFILGNGNWESWKRMPIADLCSI